MRSYAFIALAGMIDTEHLQALCLALVCQTIGAEPARERIGVNSTGLPFNSVMAVALNPHWVMDDARRQA